MLTHTVGWFNIEVLNVKLATMVFVLTGSSKLAQIRGLPSLPYTSALTTVGVGALPIIKKIYLSKFNMTLVL